jgi:hypothetical protein
MTGQKDVRQQLRQARRGVEYAERERVAAARVAKEAGIPMHEIATLLGFKRRRSIYVMLERGR